MKIKELFCRHKELSNIKIEYRDCKYNEFLKKTMLTEYPYRKCLKCGKKVELPICKPTFLENIEKEKYEEFKEREQGKLKCWCCNNENIEKGKKGLNCGEIV